jgi:hypothetical protein
MLDLKCTLTISNGNLVVKTPYDAGFVQALKALVPATQRKFDAGTKSWIVDPGQSKTVADLIGQYFGQLVMIPAMNPIKPVIDTRILEVHYIGACKDRSSEISAFGFLDGEWSVVFTEQVLKTWFMDQTSTGIKSTLYQLLGITQQSSPDEIKSAYRRMARQWHPDFCKEPDAAERFLQIQNAYELLSNQNKRARYDAGLIFEASIGNQQPIQINTGLYRSPLRCGLILANGFTSLDRFIVTQILAWDDITDSQGRVLVTSWPMGATRPVEVWA